VVAPARRAAWRVLQTTAQSGSDLAASLEHHRQSLTDSRDRALMSELVLGVLRWRAALDHAIAWAGQREAGAFDAGVLDILRIGAYQLLHLSRVPASAAVHDAVDQCRETGFGRATTAVNAILRTLSRRRDEIPWPEPDDALRFLSLTLSHPEWLAARWITRLGLESATDWARFNNEPAPVVLRAHTWRESRDELAVWLRTQGVETEPTRFAPDGLVVTDGNPVVVPDGPGIRFTIQDESSQLVAAYVDARPGERVLDTCASPGGKSTALAAGTGPAGLVVACDLRPRRIRLLQRTLAAAAPPPVAVLRADATAAPACAPVFDAVLVDAPCSGLATIRRDPDIRWRRQPSDLVDLAAVQGRMLAAASTAVRPGGRLVYATCSSEPDENQAVIEQFLEEHAGWRRDSPSGPSGVPGGLAACLNASGDLSPTPDGHGLEPYFACRLHRAG
jgi:16S rRNA (cytosine967-C5)-methyltransferase